MLNIYFCRYARMSSEATLPVDSIDFTARPSIPLGPNSRTFPSNSRISEYRRGFTKLSFRTTSRKTSRRYWYFTRQTRKPENVSSNFHRIMRAMHTAWDFLAIFIKSGLLIKRKLAINVVWMDTCRSPRCDTLEERVVNISSRRNAKFQTFHASTYNNSQNSSLRR